MACLRMLLEGVEFEDRSAGLLDEAIKVMADNGITVSSHVVAVVIESLHVARCPAQIAFGGSAVWRLGVAEGF